MIIAFDWDGTICRKEVADEASVRRFHELGEDVDREWLKEAQKTHAHFDLNKRLIEKKYGISDEREKTLKMTELFRKYYLEVVSEWKEKVFYEGMIGVLKELHKKADLAIVTTIRQDIIECSLDILKMRGLFSHVYGNTPYLDHSKSALMKMLVSRKERPALMIGDRFDDLVAGREAGAKTVLVLWGNNTEEAKDSADFVVDRPSQIIDIFSELEK